MAAFLLLAVLAHGCSGNKEAIRRDAQSAYKMGVAFLQEGRPAQALRELTNAENLSPDDPEIVNAVGLAYWARRELGIAEQKFKKAVSLSTDYSDAWNNLGALYMDEGRFQDAVAPLERALKNPLYGTQERALANLGWSLYRLGKVEEAERRLRESVDAAPGFSLAKKQLGIVLRDKGQCREALAHLDQAARLLPDDAETQLNRGQCLLALGDRGSAREAFQRAWQLAPTNEVGRVAKTYVDRLE